MQNSKCNKIHLVHKITQRFTYDVGYVVFSVSEIDPLEAHRIYFDCFYRYS